MVPLTYSYFSVLSSKWKKYLWTNKVALGARMSGPQSVPKPNKLLHKILRLVGCLQTIPSHETMVQSCEPGWFMTNFGLLFGLCSSLVRNKILYVTVNSNLALWNEHDPFAQINVFVVAPVVQSLEEFKIQMLLVWCVFLIDWKEFQCNLSLNWRLKKLWGEILLK